MHKTHKALYIGVIAIFACFLSSCVTPPIKPQLAPAPRQAVAPVIRQDIFHVVAPGETLWRISRMYNVPAQEISRANKLYSKEPVLEKGQRLLIPGAAPVMPVISLYPSKKWKYIIIHHSATDEGSSLSFDRAHLMRGWDGVGYHFVIDNGSKGKRDGQIEVSPRWLKQDNGSHCKAGNMNTKAIGICLVGDFSKDAPTPKQIDALVYLINRLKKYYGISISRIMGHGQVPGARTECPGRNFPWRELKSRFTTGQ
jgi:LysM repeat protein